MHHDLRLPFHFDPGELHAGFDIALREVRMMHFNQGYYEGDWSGRPCSPSASSASTRDPDLGHAAGKVRVHVPVRTNPQLEFYVNQERIVMQEGIRANAGTSPSTTCTAFRISAQPIASTW